MTKSRKQNPKIRPADTSLIFGEIQRTTGFTISSFGLAHQTEGQTRSGMRINISRRAVKHLGFAPGKVVDERGSSIKRFKTRIDVNKI